MNTPTTVPSHPRSDSGLHVQGLTITGPDGVIVEDVSFSIPPGSSVALVGASGSGKSLTARSLLGLLPDELSLRADTLRLNDTDLGELDERGWRSIRGAQIGLVLQDALGSLDPLRRIGDEVGEALRAHTDADTRARDHRSRELLESVGIPDALVRMRQYPHQLSGGQRQRALIASAIAAAPSILVADEPTTALDSTVQAQVLDELARRVDEGVGILLISHDLAVVARMADYVLVMHAGRVVEEGATAAVLGHPRHPVTRALLKSQPRPAPRRTTVGARPAESVLSLTNISAAYRSRSADPEPPGLRNISLELRSGSILGVVGESGSGKTTLSRIVTGFMRPTEGEVLLEGRPWAPLGEHARRSRRPRIQLVSQDPLGSFDPRFRIGALLHDSLRPSGLSSQERARRIEGALEIVDLDPRLLTEHPRFLSGGQRQRVAIARALIAEPAVIVADEPVSALDVVVQARVLDAFDRLRRETGTSVLFISHDFAVIQAISDDVAVLHEGRLVEFGAVDEVFRSPQHPVTQLLIDSVLWPEAHLAHI